MTETRTPSTDRWIPALGAATVVEAVLSCWMTGTIQLLYLYFLLTGFLPAAAGALMLFGRKRDALSLRFAFAAIVGLHVTVASQIIAAWTRESSLFLLQPVGMLLIGVGAALLWGSSLARHDHPGNPALQEISRVGAGLIQLGFIFEFVTRVRNWEGMQSVMTDSGAAAGAAFALSSLLDIAAGVALLWASIEAMRTPLDDEAELRRARRSHRLLMGWVLLTPTYALVFQLSFLLRQYSPGFTVYELGSAMPRLLLDVTLPTATSFVLARWLRLQFAAPASPMPRSGGVE